MEGSEPRGPNWQPVRACMRICLHVCDTGCPHRGVLARRNSSSLVTVSPGIQGILPRTRRASTPLSHNTPCASSNDLFHGPLIADQVCQRFRSGFTRKEAGRVWIQPLVNNSFAISCGLCLSQYQIRIIWVGTGCNPGTVIEDI